MPDFKASKDRLTLVSGNAAGYLKLMFTYHLESPKTRRSHVTMTLPVLYKWNNKVCLHVCLQLGLLNSEPTVENYYSEREGKKNSFQNISVH